MTRDEAKKLLPIIQAFAEGKNVQIKQSNGKWVSFDYSSFGSHPDFYRIAPDPVEQAMEIYENSIRSQTDPIKVSQIIKEGLAAVLKAIKDGTIVL